MRASGRVLPPNMNKPAAASHADGWETGQNPYVCSSSDQLRPRPPQHVSTQCIEYLSPCKRVWCSPLSGDESAVPPFCWVLMRPLAVLGSLYERWSIENGGGNVSLIQICSGLQPDLLINPTAAGLL